MPNTESPHVPRYRRHKPSGQAVVTLNGKDHYLGRYNSAASREAYNRLIQEWLTAGRGPLNPKAQLTVNELILAYWRTVEGSFAPTASGQDPGELHCLRTALRLVREFYGRTAASAFGPLALKAVRLKMIDKRWCRAYINRQVNRIRRLFRWAVSEEMIPADVYHGLQSVEGLRRGKSPAREKDPVKPVPEAFVKAVLPFLSPPACAMVELQWHTGMRPGEVLGLRGCDLDATCKVWTYTPQVHKTQHLGHKRVVYLGPKAQLIIRPFLKVNPSDFLFSPANAEVLRNVQRRQRRKSPLTPSHLMRKPKANRRRAPG